MHEIAAILEAIHKRFDRTIGIGIAADYVKTIFACTDGKCGVHPRDIATDDEWHACIKAASNQLVYIDEESGIVEVKNGRLSRTKKLTDTPGAAIDYITVLTTTSKDRDGDILETKGAEPDLRMPALYQHIPFDPVGKLVQITKHTRNRLEGHFAVLGNEYGNDIALMVEFGMLRTSIGFMPMEWERLKAEEGEEEWMAGFHMLRFKILEDSLVSVPSQEDSLITQHSRNKFAHPLTKLHAQSLWDAKPDFAVSGFEAMKDIAQIVREKASEAFAEHIESLILKVEHKAEEEPCGCKSGDDDSDDVEIIIEEETPVAPAAEPNANQLATSLLAKLLKGEHVDYSLATALTESLEQEKTQAQMRALSALIA